MDIVLTILTLGIVRFVFVKEGTNQVITRYGKYSKTLSPGLQMFLSFWGFLGSIHPFHMTDPQTSQRTITTEIDMKEIVYDYPRERVISADNVQFEVNAVIYFRVFDPYKALFKVNDYTGSLRTLVQSILRAEIGKHDLEETYSNRTEISRSLTLEADQATDDWGIRVIRLEIKEFELGDFAEQLLRQKQQDIEKRQQVLQAEGTRDARVRIAEGEKLAAQADAEATVIRAKAEADALTMRYKADALGYQAIAEILRTNPEVLHYLKYHAADVVSRNLGQGQATKIFLPNSIDQLLSAFTVISDSIAITTGQIDDNPITGGPGNDNDQA